MAECVSDQGLECSGEFQELLRTALIDDRRTSPNHPQADALAERTVQSTKRALRKHADAVDRKDQWDDALPHIALGYNASKQASTGYSPFYLLYGKHPVIPPSTFRRFEEAVNFDDMEGSAQALLDRAEAIKQACLMAGEALKVAQHRQTLRFALIRGGA